MAMLQYVPLTAMVATIEATVLRGISVRQRTGDRPLAFLSAIGVQRLAGMSFAMSTATLIAAMRGVPKFALAAAILAALGALLVIVAQVQMGRAWQIGVRAGDAPLFVSHGLFRFSRNPIFVGKMLTGLAAAIASGLWWPWAALAVFVVSCCVQVRIEEAHLEANFGQSYRDFRVAVPRWLGFEAKSMGTPTKEHARRFIADEMQAYHTARSCDDAAAAWRALERAHIVSQPYLSLHLGNHSAMLSFAIAQRDAGEIVGQIFRFALAPLGSLTGRIQRGNSGRSNVSAFEPMPIPDDLRDVIGEVTK